MSQVLCLVSEFAMKPRENSKAFLKVALFSLIVILAILAVSRSAIIGVLERSTEDLRFQMRRSAAVDPRLSLILVDSATMDRYGYPVPRRYYGVAAKAICDAGASVVAIDRTFEARDPVDDVGGAILAEVVKQHNNIVFLNTHIEKICGQRIHYPVSLSIGNPFWRHSNQLFLVWGIHKAFSCWELFCIFLKYPPKGFFPPKTFLRIPFNHFLRSKYH